MVMIRNIPIWDREPGRASMLKKFGEFEREQGVIDTSKTSLNDSLKLKYFMYWQRFKRGMTTTRLQQYPDKKKKTPEKGEKGEKE